MGGVSSAIGQLAGRPSPARSSRGEEIFGPTYSPAPGRDVVVSIVGLPSHWLRFIAASSATAIQFARRPLSNGFGFFFHAPRMNS